MGFNLEHLEEAVDCPEPVDVVAGVVLMVLVLEGTRQAWGMTLPPVAALFIAYFLFGHLIPGTLHHRIFNFECKILYKSAMDPAYLNQEYDTELYPQKDYHTLYFGEIVDCYQID